MCRQRRLVWYRRGCCHLRLQLGSKVVARAGAASVDMWDHHQLERFAGGAAGRDDAVDPLSGAVDLKASCWLHRLQRTADTDDGSASGQVRERIRHQGRPHVQLLLLQRPAVH